MVGRHFRPALLVRQDKNRRKRVEHRGLRLNQQQFQRSLPTVPGLQDRPSISEANQAALQQPAAQMPQNLRTAHRLILIPLHQNKNKSSLSFGTFGFGGVGALLEAAISAVETGNPGVQVVVVALEVEQSHSLSLLHTDFADDERDLVGSLFWIVGHAVTVLKIVGVGSRRHEEDCQAARVALVSQVFGVDSVENVQLVVLVELHHADQLSVGQFFDH